MSFSIIRVAKVKSKTNTRGIQKHVQRENKNYENKDIDLDKSHLNYDLVNNTAIDFNQKIDEKIEENYNGKRKIRTDAVKHIDGLITSDDEFFSHQSPEDTKQFFEQAKTFLEEEYGKENLLYATVHMDEKTPHMHYGIVPITKDGRLSAKEVIGNKKALTEFQDRFNTYINEQGYDLERGLSRHLTNDEHDQVSRYKQKTEYHKQEYSHEIEKLSHIKQENEKLMEEYQKSLDTLKKPLSVPYEVETENVGGWFNKEQQETGNVVISKDDFEQYNEQIKAAQMIVDDYEFIKSGQALTQARKKYDEKEDELGEALESHDELVDDYNNLVERYNDLDERNQKNAKRAKQAEKAIKGIFEMIKDILPENVYHKLINQIDDRMQSPRMREFMITDEQDRAFFNQKYPVQDISFEQDRDDGYSL